MTLSGYIPVLQSEGKLEELTERFEALADTSLPRQGRSWDSNNPDCLLFLFSLTHTHTFLNNLFRAACTALLLPLSHPLPFQQSSPR